MKTIEINATGKMKEKDVSRRELTEEFGIHTRDLRPVFTLKQVTTIMPRGKAIIVNFRSVKLIIGAEKTYVFNLGNPDVRDNFIPEFQEKISTDQGTVLFEHLALDMALSYMLSKTHERFEDIEKSVAKILQKLKKDVDDKDFEKLLHLKKQLSKFLINTKEAESLIVELVEDDNDLKELYLQSQAPSDTSEVESILENVLEQIENVSHRAVELDENVDDTQEILTLKMANLRNTIIRFDLLISTITGALALLAVVVGLYGMNLKNHLEADPAAFNVVGGILIFLFLFFVGGVFFFLKRKKVL